MEHSIRTPIEKHGKYWWIYQERKVTVINDFSSTRWFPSLWFLIKSTFHWEHALQYTGIDHFDKILISFFLLIAFYFSYVQVASFCDFFVFRFFIILYLLLLSFFWVFVSLVFICFFYVYVSSEDDKRQHISLSMFHQYCIRFFRVSSKYSYYFYSDSIQC